jgi:hypothetical protein
MVEGKKCRWSFLIDAVNRVSGMRINCEPPPLASTPLVIDDGTKTEQLE